MKKIFRTTEKFQVASAEELQRMIDASLRKRRKEFGAAPSTIEAIMFELRSYGMAALAGANCQRRLAELSPDQLVEVIQRLMSLRPKYPAITDQLIFILAEKLPPEKLK
jgi:hypothetical protein